MNFYELLNLAEKTGKTVVFAQKDATPIMSKLYQEISGSKLPSKLKYDSFISDVSKENIVKVESFKMKDYANVLS